MNYSSYIVLCNGECKKLTEMSSNELRNEVLEITKEQYYILNLGLSAVNTSNVIREMQERKIKLLSLLGERS